MPSFLSATACCLSLSSYINISVYKRGRGCDVDRDILGAPFMWVCPNATINVQKKKEEKKRERYGFIMSWKQKIVYL